MRKTISKNKTAIKLLSIFFALLIATGCGNVLDEVEDLSNYPGEGTFDDIQTVQAYLARCYNLTLGGWPVNDGNKADESGSIIPTDWITTSNGAMNYWPYSSIRTINILIQELPEGAVPEDDKPAILAQARFLRAYHYFKMVVYHGGVPIIREPQSLEDDLMVSRNSTKECFDFIIEDLDYAIANLPNKYTGSDFGRIDKASALSFKGRVLLYKASPQFNSSNPYGNAYWQEAYTANKTAIDFLNANGYGLLEDYTSIFETEGHKENILSVVYKDPVKSNGRGENSVRPLSETKNATGGDQPIWALAEAYPMLDGKMPGDPTSKYTYDVQTFWKDRDPRFAATLVWNGEVYELSGKSGRRQYTMTNIASSVDAFGYVIQGESTYRTGLFCRKGINESLTPELVGTNDYDWVEIRYTEVLFNYAESANETGKSDVAIQALKDIRERAGIEPGTNGMFGLKSGMTKEEVREALLQEKYIEMVFEGKRFWDLRRHRMLNRIDGMHKYGIMTMKVEDRTYDQVTPDDAAKANKYEWLPENFTYSVEELITTGQTQMSMPDKYYFFPIQLDNIDKDPNLEQNKDWGGTFNPEL
ncbi:RagB/SusD family nutrient uptake outer membrane protein [Maribellus sp. CM-23]|uniref:RagB/SusD family nutrient uptake outer membrane protein n=1 Tax=Maribellus sp. CM-23 TaxID=2781026 RepID=UPI001F272DB9|nr:RagB/SusD family nutrient uptake outer membrane protein [Maribellus sp. CM-23]MCE4565824.1 RagB/SusD family nutrient uptake outer membrane protein [Maribellus sp. CM-23]